MNEQVARVPVARRTVDVTDEAVRSRRERRAELLEQRERAAELRRRRRFGLRLPTSQPLVLAGSGRARIG